jgi:hypothetical protein
MVAFEAPLARTLLLVGTLLVAVWLLAVLLVTAWRQRSSAALLLALATVGQRRGRCARTSGCSGCCTPTAR